MCKNCEGTSIILPKGDPGAPGLPGVSINGVNGIEESVVFDTSFNILYQSIDFINSIPLDNLGVPDLTAYRTLAYFIFPGTNNLNGVIPNKLYMSGVTTSNFPLPGYNRWQVRIRNSNDVIVAESTVILNTTYSLIDLGTVSNLPTDIDKITIEVFLISQTNTSTTIQLNTLLLTKI